MTSVETVPDKKKLDAGQVRKIGEIWEQLARIYGDAKALDTEFVKQHIQRSNGTTKSNPELADKLLELKETDKAKADDRA